MSVIAKAGSSSTKVQFTVRKVSNIRCETFNKSFRLSYNTVSINRLTVKMCKGETKIHTVSYVYFFYSLVSGAAMLLEKSTEL